MSGHTPDGTRARALFGLPVREALLVVAVALAIAVGIAVFAASTLGTAAAGPGVLPAEPIATEAALPTPYDPGAP